jgi:cytochrome c oxidase subunit 4
MDTVTESTAAARHGHESHRLYLWVWLYLLGLTALEIALALVDVFSTMVMLVILMALSIVKAGLIVAYFMHLRFERKSLVLSLVPGVVVIISLLFAFFPDSFRILELGTQ